MIRIKYNRKTEELEWNLDFSQAAAMNNKAWDKFKKQNVPYIIKFMDKERKNYLKAKNKKLV